MHNISSVHRFGALTVSLIQYSSKAGFTDVFDRFGYYNAKLCVRLM